MEGGMGGIAIDFKPIVGGALAALGAQLGTVEQTQQRAAVETGAAQLQRETQTRGLVGVVAVVGVALAIAAVVMLARKKG
jgi:hypothetical protein